MGHSFTGSLGSLDRWIAGSLDRYDFKSPVDFYRDLAAKYDTPLTFGELDYRSVDGAATKPGDWGFKGTQDLHEQSDLYAAFFKVFSTETSWFKGVYFFDWQADGESYTTDYSVMNKPALAVLSSWFQGHATADSTFHIATISEDKLFGGAGDDMLIGGRGGDILKGAEGDDVLYGDSPAPMGNPNLLVVQAVGDTALGVDAKMQVIVNGKVIATVDVPKSIAGQAFPTFNFALPDGVQIDDVSVAFVNNTPGTAAEDRNLYRNLSF